MTECDCYLNDSPGRRKRSTKQDEVIATNHASNCCSHNSPNLRDFVCTTQKIKR